MDKISKKVGTEILSVYRRQNILQLSEWFNRFPNAIDLLEDALGEAPIKHAIRESHWLALAFLINVPNASRKAKQIATAKYNENPICAFLLQSHIQKREISQLKTLTILHERVRL